MQGRKGWLLADHLPFPGKMAKAGTREEWDGCFSRSCDRQVLLAFQFPQSS